MSNPKRRNVPWNNVARPVPATAPLMTTCGAPALEKRSLRHAPLGQGQKRDSFGSDSSGAAAAPANGDSGLHAQSQLCCPATKPLQACRIQTPVGAAVDGHSQVSDWHRLRVWSRQVRETGKSFAVALMRHHGNETASGLHVVVLDNCNLT